MAPMSDQRTYAICKAHGKRLEVLGVVLDAPDAVTATRRVWARGMRAWVVPWGELSERQQATARRGAIITVGKDANLAGFPG
jgi:hypothetical protein